MTRRLSRRPPKRSTSRGTCRKPARAFLRFKANWQAAYPSLVRRLEKDLPELLTFSRFLWPLWRKLYITNAIERCFVEVRRRTLAMVFLTNVQSVDRIVYALFNRYIQDRKQPTLHRFTQAA